MLNEKILEAFVDRNFDVLVQDVKLFDDFVTWNAVRAGGFVFAFELDDDCLGWASYKVTEERAGRPGDFDNCFGSVDFKIPDPGVPNQRIAPKCFDKVPIWYLGHLPTS